MSLPIVKPLLSWRSQAPFKEKRRTPPSQWSGGSFKSEPGPFQGELRGALRRQVRPPRGTASSTPDRRESPPHPAASPADHRPAARPPATSVRNVPPQRDARAAPGKLRWQRGGRSARRGRGAGGSKRLRKGERKGRRGWVRRGAAGRPAGGRRLLPRPLR